MIPIHHISQTWKDASLLVDNTAAKPIQANPSTVLSIPHIAGFIGRKDILEKTVTAINSEGLMIVQGLAGIGKTTLVAKATKLSTSIFHDVAWIKCIENTSYDYIVLRLTQFLAGYGTEDMLSSVVKGASLPAPDQFFPEFLNIIQTLKVLIIFDDFDNALNRYRYISDNRLSQLIEMLIEHSYESKIVLVTRFIPKIRSKYQYQTVKIGGLNCATSVDLFKKSVQGDYESIMYQEVHNLTGGHPFAIRILASLTQYYPLQHLLADKALYLDECGQNLLQRLFSTIPNKEVLITKRLSVLRMAFSLDAFMGIGGEIKNVESMIARFLLDFDVSSAVYSIHPLIRDYSYKNTRPSIRKEYHREAADYFSSKFFIGRLDVHNADDAIEASYHFSRAGDLQNTIAIPIGFTESLHFLGVSYFRKKQYVKSESCFDAILKLDDSDTRGHFYYAASIDLQGQSRRENSSATIEEHYQRALDVQPNNVQYIDYYAYFLMNLNHYPQAEELFRKGVQLGATCPTLYRRYGLLMKRLGQIDQAEKIFSKGCKIAYKNGLIYLEYARMKLERGKFREAEDIIVAGLSVNRGFKPLVTALDTLKKNREI